jgi:hypothetical protein
MTKTAFLAAYRAKIVANYPWASDSAKLDRFMAAVETTIRTEQKPWSIVGAATTEAWQEIGGAGKPTYKALRALEER